MSPSAALALTLALVQLLTIESSNHTHAGVHIQIFDNIAEISRPISPYDLPIAYSQDEWNDVRPDSFRLVGEHLNVQAQIVSHNRTSSNGQRVLIQRSSHNDTYTAAIMIDEARNLIHDLVDQTYYTIAPDRIKYLSIPFARKYLVDFVFDTNQPAQLFLRYLQNNIRWKVRYDLLLESNETDSILQAFADIRNDGSSSLMIDSAELTTGDVQIRSTTTTFSSPYGGFADFDNAAGANGQQALAVTTPAAPMISQGEELAGVYLFSINETFILDPQSNYILPMFRPSIEVERYGSIDKYFRRFDHRGNAQRAYRLRAPDRYLPKGQVFVRESDRLVGEISWPDFSANETNEFTLGEDPDVQFNEDVQLISRRQAYEANGYRFVLSTYTISLQLVNNKKHPMVVEYRLRFSSQDNLTLKENGTDSLLQVDGSTITGTFALNAGEEQELKFTFETL